MLLILVKCSQCNPQPWIVLARAVLEAMRTVKEKVKGVKVKLIRKKDMDIIPIKNPKEVGASPTRMGKAIMGPREVIAITTENRKEAEASPTHMGKAIMGPRRVMENPMATKHRPTEDMADMESMVQVPSNMSCTINTSWV